LGGQLILSPPIASKKNTPPGLQKQEATSPEEQRRRIKMKKREKGEKREVPSHPIVRGTGGENEAPHGRQFT